MSTLIERKNIIVNKISNLKSGDHIQDDIDNLKTRLMSITRQRDNIKRCLDRKQLFSDHKIDCQINAELSPQFKKDLEEKINQCKDNLDNIKELNVDDFFRPLKKYSDETNSNLITCWEKFVGHSPIGSDVINVLKNVPGYEEKTTRLLGAINTLSEARNTTSITKTLVEKVRKAQEEIKKIDNEFKDIPIDVMEFLQNASKHQAKYSDLTPEIEKWLNANNILDSLKISL